jgi:hypothetical protein
MSVLKIFVLSSSFQTRLGLSIDMVNPIYSMVARLHDACHEYLQLGVSMEEEVLVTSFQLSLFLEVDEVRQLILTKVETIPNEENFLKYCKLASSAPEWIKRMNGKYGEHIKRSFLTTKGNCKSYLFSSE